MRKNKIRTIAEARVLYYMIEHQETPKEIAARLNIKEEEVDNIASNLIIAGLFKKPKRFINNGL